MSTFQKKTDRMDIFIEEYRNTILVKQRWKYNWLNDVKTTPWTYLEKRTFHNKMDSLIWQQWGGQYRLKVNGTSGFAKQYHNKEFILNFDIQWELNDAHWTVNTTKTNNPRTISSVGWSSRVINLDSYDDRVKTFGNITGQTGATHEFGHAIGNSAYAYSGGHGDEYKSSSSYYSDKRSIMNLGNELRERHIDYLLRQLNTIIKATTFQYKSIKT